MTAEKGKRVGRPRSEASRQAVLDAARQLLDERGVMGVTMEGIATRAGVGKPTVYRWWEDRFAVLMEALLDAEPVNTAVKAGASPRQALLGQLLSIARRFSSPAGRHITSLLASADSTSDLAKAFRSHFLLARRAEGIALLKDAQGSGEVDVGLDVEVAADALYGALFIRLMVGHAPFNVGFANRLLEVVAPPMRR